MLLGVHIGAVQREVQVRASKCGSLLREVVAEEGRTLQCVLVPDDKEARRMVVSFRTGLEVRKVTASPSEQLRPNQATDTMRWLVGQKHERLDALLTEVEIWARVPLARAEEAATMVAAQREAERVNAPPLAGMSDAEGLKQEAMLIEHDVTLSTHALQYAQMQKDLEAESSKRKGKGHKGKHGKGSGGRGGKKAASKSEEVPAPAEKEAQGWRQ